jgi:hypothetical protein
MMAASGLDLTLAPVGAGDYRVLGLRSVISPTAQVGGVAGCGVNV